MRRALAHGATRLRMDKREVIAPASAASATAASAHPRDPFTLRTRAHQGRGVQLPAGVAAASRRRCHCRTSNRHRRVRR